MRREIKLSMVGIVIKNRDYVLGHPQGPEWSDIVWSKTPPDAGTKLYTIIPPTEETDVVTTVCHKCCCMEIKTEG